jgi:hypothetical protein
MLQSVGKDDKFGKIGSSPQVVLNTRACHGFEPKALIRLSNGIRTHVTSRHPGTAGQQLAKQDAAATPDVQNLFTADFEFQCLKQPLGATRLFIAYGIVCTV